MQSGQNPELLMLKYSKHINAIWAECRAFNAKADDTYVK
jgi:hypothetical protein